MEQVPGTKQHTPSSRLLEELLDQAPADYFTLGWLTVTLDQRSFCIIMLFLGLLADQPELIAQVGVLRWRAAGSVGTPGPWIKSTTKGSFTLTINGKKLKSGRHRLTITATDSAGHVTTTRKSFSVCKAAKPRRNSSVTTPNRM